MKALALDMVRDLGLKGVPSHRPGPDVVPVNSVYMEVCGIDRDPHPWMPGSASVTPPNTLGHKNCGIVTDGCATKHLIASVEKEKCASFDPVSDIAGTPTTQTQAIKTCRPSALSAHVPPWFSRRQIYHEHL